MSGEDLLKYIEKKLRRNSLTFRITKKIMAEKGLKSLA
ncbi:hypothetical protein MNBD_NITROSPINAE05-784, partial [hydrothermal vent metagenome]